MWTLKATTILKRCSKTRLNCKEVLMIAIAKEQQIFNYMLTCKDLNNNHSRKNLLIKNLLIEMIPSKKKSTRRKRKSMRRIRKKIHIHIKLKFLNLYIQIDIVIISHSLQFINHPHFKINRIKHFREAFQFLIMKIIWIY